MATPATKPIPAPAPATSPDVGVSDANRPKKVTLRSIARMAASGEKFACLTAYDATTARWLARAGVPLLLVGDTAAEMILGETGTIHAPLDFLITLTAAVNGAPNTVVVGDMPFMSYQAEDAEGVRNAGRFLTEGRADAVKLEVDRSFEPLVRQIVRAGIPVIAHVGCKPQQFKLRGYSAAGKTAVEAAGIVEDARIMEDAGATMLLIEAAPNEVAQRVIERTSVPVIGCGAGTACHGQIVVTQDILGLTEWQPAFAQPIASAGTDLVRHAQRWMDMVRTSALGEHPYVMTAEEAARFAQTP